MTQRLVNNYGLIVDRKAVRELLKILHPEGAESRAKRSLKRRQYRTRGSIFLWHMDGYDKLKPFGFCIHGQHGAIYGFNRRILRLDVGRHKQWSFRYLSVLCWLCATAWGNSTKILQAKRTRWFGSNEQFYVWQISDQPTDRGLVRNSRQRLYQMVDRLFQRYEKWWALLWWWLHLERMS